MPARLPYTGNDEADELISTDPLALLVGFALDQQVTVQKAFEGPLVLKQRVGSLDAEILASADLEPIFRQKPAPTGTAIEPWTSARLRSLDGSRQPLLSEAMGHSFD